MARQSRVLGAEGSRLGAILRGRAVAAHLVHTQEVEGSIPSPAIDIKGKLPTWSRRQTENLFMLVRFQPSPMKSLLDGMS
jgi:hypothetical protein